MDAPVSEREKTLTLVAVAGLVTTVVLAGILVRMATKGHEEAPHAWSPAQPLAAAAGSQGDDGLESWKDREVVPLVIEPSLRHLLPHGENSPVDHLQLARRIPLLEEAGSYACSECHNEDDHETDMTVRELTEEHEDVHFNHGGKRFWCLTCHNPEDRDTLITLEDQKVSFDQPHMVCGQCHYSKELDFLLGAHGKTLGHWQGNRILAACTDCHNPHDPSPLQQTPCCLPKPRSGLARIPGDPSQYVRPWDELRTPPGLLPHPPTQKPGEKK